MRMPTHNVRTARIERLARIDVLKEMAAFMPSLKLPEEPGLPDPPPASVPSVLPVFMEQPANAPPLHPAPVDRGRFRIAEEPIGTDLGLPWQSDRCVECRLPTWTHNHVVAARHETICEDCYFRMVSDYWEEQGKRLHQATLRVINPFER